MNRGARVPNRIPPWRTAAGVAVLAGIALIAIAVYFSYAYAQKLTTKISPLTVNGILRVIAFILLCIGVQIAWNGLAALMRSAGKA